MLWAWKRAQKLQNENLRYKIIYTDSNQNPKRSETFSLVSNIHVWTENMGSSVLWIFTVKQGLRRKRLRSDP